MDPTANQKQNDDQNQQPKGPVGTVSNVGVVGGIVGNVKKEAEPIPGASEIITPVEQEVPVEKELREVGVEAVKSSPDLTLADQKAGLSLAKEFTPHFTQPTGAVKFPLTEEEEKHIRKNVGSGNSVRWLAELIHSIRMKMRKGGSNVS